MSHSVPPGSLLRRGGSLLYFGNRLVKLLWTRTRGVRNSSSVLHKARRKCWCFIGRCNPWAARVSEREGGGTGKDGEEMRAGPASGRGTAGHSATWDVSEQTLRKHRASEHSITEERSHLLARTPLSPFAGQASPHRELLPWASRLLPPGGAGSYTQRHKGPSESGHCGSCTGAAGGRAELLPRVHHGGDPVVP